MRGLPLLAAFSLFPFLSSEFVRGDLLEPGDFDLDLERGVDAGDATGVGNS